MWGMERGSKPTIETIQSLCNQKSFARGSQYYKEGRVREFRISGDAVNAKVKGTRNYQVEVNHKRDFESTCTCPYDFDGYCKHIVATLIALSKDYEGIMSRSESEEERVENALRSMDVALLRDFLRKKFSRDESLKSHFLIYATGEVETGGKSVNEYKKEIARLYDDASDDGFIEYENEIDFSSFHELAERYVEKKNFVEAAKVYQALSEVIAENMDIVDDSDGHYGNRFGEALEGLSSSMKSLEQEGKISYITHLFERFMKSEPDYFQDNYDDALREVCTSKEDLKHLEELLWPYLPKDLPDRSKNWSKYHDSVVLLGTHRFVLDGLANWGDDESKKELYELLQRYSMQDEDLCLLYAERLEKDGKLEGAIKVAEEGLEVFPAHLTKELRLFLDKHYMTLSPDKYNENLKRLFFEEKDWSYYEKLKKLARDRWTSVFQEIIERFSSPRSDTDGMILIDIYLKEKMFDKALKEVLARKNLYTLSKYYKQLAERYPKDYFNVYKDLLLPYADSRMGRDHYHRVVSELRKMKGIKDFEKEFEEYIEMLRAKYAKRTAFLEEMKRL